MHCCSYIYHAPDWESTTNYHTLWAGPGTVRRRRKARVHMPVAAQALSNRGSASPGMLARAEVAARLGMLEPAPPTQQLEAQCGVACMQNAWGIARTIDYYINQTVPKSKINVGLALFGISWKLADPAKNGIGAASTGGGANGPCTPGAPWRRAAGSAGSPQQGVGRFWLS